MSKYKDPRSEALIVAIDEAHRFIKQAVRALEDEQPSVWSSQHRAAAKQASMDLTRALAKYRQA